MGRPLLFGARQALLVLAAALAYFGVRGLTEGDPTTAYLNAVRVLRVERRIGIDIELELQELVRSNEMLVDLANWVYIWGHWPVIAATLAVLAFRNPGTYRELRNAMFLSGAVGLLVFALFPVTPPRLFGAEYLDTVTARSTSYRVLQPPALVNKYAAIPSLHVGWNLIVGLTWARVGRARATTIAVVATANHWVLDVALGSAFGLGGVAAERWRAERWPALRRWLGRGPADRPSGRPGLAPDPGEALAGGDERERQHQPQDREQQAGHGEPDGQRDDPLRPLHDPTLGVEAERLRLGPLVGDQPRQRHHRNRDHHQQAPVVVDEVPDHAPDQHRVRHPIGGRVEERTPDRCRAGRLGHGAVEEIGYGRNDQQDAADAQLTPGDEEG